MDRSHLRFALPVFALLLSIARQASATPPDQSTAAETQAAALVDDQLVKPLAAKEARRNRFSRGYIPPEARRVRVLDRRLSTDALGAQFVAFAVDERSGRLTRRAADDSAGWRTDAILGCVYLARGEVFIKRGDKFFRASLLLGQKVAAAGDAVCRAAPARS